MVLYFTPYYPLLFSLYLDLQIQAIQIQGCKVTSPSHPASFPTHNASATGSFQVNVWLFIFAFKNPQPNRKLNFNLNEYILTVVMEPAHLHPEN